MLRPRSVLSKALPAAQLACPRATAELLHRAVDDGKLHPQNARRLGRLSVSGIGFGAYRMGVDAPAGAEGRRSVADGQEAESAEESRVTKSRSLDSLKCAFRSGVLNLVETSSHYGQYHGQSEELIGQALREVAGESGESGESGAGIRRDQVVIVTKLGHGPPLHPSAASEASEAASIEELVGYSEVSGGHFLNSGGNTGNQRAPWHCLHPRFLLAEFARSCARLGTNPDFVFLHNPEFFLTDCLEGRGRFAEEAADREMSGEVASASAAALPKLQVRPRVPVGKAWDELYRRLEDAFAVLEALTATGQIHGYGVSANFLSCFFSVSGRPNGYEAVDLQRCLGAVVAAARRKEPRAELADTGFVGIQVNFDLQRSFVRKKFS